MRVECAECDRLWRAYERAQDEKTSLDELVRIGLDFLGDGSVSVEQLRKAARNAQQQLEGIKSALRDHKATHKAKEDIT